MRPRFFLPTFLLASLFAAGCAPDSADEAPDTGSDVGADAPAGAPEVSAEDQEAILQTGLLGQWEWVGLQGVDDVDLEIADPSKYTLTFTVDGVQVQADCNRATGSYDLDGSNLTFGPMAMTQRACLGESLGSRFAALLDGVGSYGFEGDQLVLSLPASGGTMAFRAGSGGA
jgi:heat shock protein HslJ